MARRHFKQHSRDKTPYIENASTHNRLYKFLTLGQATYLKGKVKKAGVTRVFEEFSDQLSRAGNAALVNVDFHVLGLAEIPIIFLKIRNEIITVSNQIGINDSHKYFQDFDALFKCWFLLASDGHSKNLLSKSTLQTFLSYFGKKSVSAFTSGFVDDDFYTLIKDALGDVLSDGSEQLFDKLWNDVETIITKRVVSGGNLLSNAQNPKKLIESVIRLIFADSLINFLNANKGKIGIVIGLDSIDEYSCMDCPIEGSVRSELAAFISNVKYYPGMVLLGGCGELILWNSIIGENDLQRIAIEEFSLEAVEAAFLALPDHQLERGFAVLSEVFYSKKKDLAFAYAVDNSWKSYA